MNNNFNHFLVQRSIVKEWWRKGFNFSDYLHIYLFLTKKLAILIAVAKTSRTMLNSSGESGHPCLLPDFMGNAFNFLPSFHQGKVSIDCRSLHVPPHNLGNQFSKNTHLHTQSYTCKSIVFRQSKSKYINFKRHIKKKKQEEHNLQRHN